MLSACCSCCSTVFAPCLPYPNLPVCRPATLTATQLLSIMVAVACTFMLPSLLTCASLCHPVQTLFMRVTPLPDSTLALRRHAQCTGVGRRNNLSLPEARASASCVLLR